MEAVEAREVLEGGNRYQYGKIFGGFIEPKRSEDRQLVELE